MLKGLVEATQLGAVIGTLAFMSPEQAQGLVDLLGPASDVYSLGATLYVLLTGRLPFEGTDAYEVLAQIHASRFPPPRQKKAGIPAALEAICLKAMALQAVDRYPTAQGLAADIEHWLADEPVTAYREPWHGQLRRWGRRHRPLVAGATALLLTALVAVGVGLVAVDRERRRAEHERDRADDNLRLARQAVDQAFTQIAENPKLQEADFHDLRKQLLKAVVPFYEQFVAQHHDDPDLEAERGKAYGRLALVRAELGETQQARTDFDQAREIFAGLAAQHPDRPQYRRDLAATHHSLGRLLADLGKGTEAAAAYRAALKLDEELATQHPTVPRYRLNLAISHHNLGILLKDLGQHTEAAVAYRAALKLSEELVAQHPAVPEYHLELARSHGNLGLLLAELGKGTEAEVALRAALKLLEELAAQHPAVPEYRLELAQGHNGLGLLLAGLGRSTEAAAVYRAALKLKGELAAQHPAVPEYRQELARSHSNLGLLLAELGKGTEAEAAYRAALKLDEELATQHPAIPDYRHELAGTLVNLADLLRQQQHYAQARALLKEAEPHHQAALKTTPSHPGYRLFYRNNRVVLALTLTGLGEHAAAARTAEQLASLGVSPATDMYNAACVLALCVPLAAKDTKLPEAERPKQARAYTDRAMELLRQAIAKGYQDIAHLKKDTDLDPLRSREDFKKLLAELEATAKVAQEQQARLQRATDLANKGRHAQAAAEATQLAEMKQASAAILYDTGCVYALCVVAVQKDTQTAAAERDKLAEDYARRAIALLRRAAQAGFNDLPHLKTNDPDLATLRGRADFQQLVQELEAKTKAQSK
jgi:tetratricopeptide (TPR) repeat protein